MKPSILLARAVLGVICSAGLSACAGLDTGNAETGQVSLGLSVAAANPVDQSGTAFTLGAVTATIGRFELYLPAGASCAGLAHCDGDKLSVRGPWTVDLRTRTATPPLPVIEAPVGTYRRVDIELESTDADVSLTASGTVTLDGAVTPFVLRLDIEERARFEGPGALLAKDQLVDVLALLDPDAWFAALPLAQCAEDGDLPFEGGTVVITDGDDDCAQVEDVIEDAIKASGRIED